MGFGVCLTDNWQLTIGYRLRYLSGNETWYSASRVERMELKVKQNLSHVAEVGLMYQF